jgi:hypothetical protein
VSVEAELPSALSVIPSLSLPGLTEAEQLALTLRRGATISGRCACGDPYRLERRGRPSRA